MGPGPKKSQIGPGMKKSQIFVTKWGLAQKSHKLAPGGKRHKFCDQMGPGQKKSQIGNGMKKSQICD